MPRSPTARSTQNPALVEATDTGRGGRSTAPRRPARARRRPFGRPARRRDRSPRASATASATSSFMVCWMAATRRRAPRTSSCPTSSRGWARRIPSARIATIGGRYFAMDRDNRWERIEAGLRRDRQGQRTPRSVRGAGVLDGYARGENDEFIQPTVIDGVDGTVRDGDVVVHFNFRADRARQLTHALVDGDEFDTTCLRPRSRPAATTCSGDDDRVRAGTAGRRSPSRR